MRKIIVTFIALAFVFPSAFSQVKVPDNVSTTLAVKVEPSQIQSFLDSVSVVTFMPAHAEGFTTHIDINDAFRQGNNYYWHFKNQGLAIRLFLDHLEFPNGDTLFVINNLNQIKETVYTANNYQSNWSSGTYNDAVTLCYKSENGAEPGLIIHEYSLEIPKVIYNKANNFGDSQCEININCSEGTDYQDQKKAVARILIKIQNGYYWCTGSLINNTSYDFTPYFITAEHCGTLPGDATTLASASDLSQWVFYFNYESTNCSNPASEALINYKQITGATFVARSHDSGGDEGSDFLLLKLNQQAFQNIFPLPKLGNEDTSLYFLGWNLSNSPPQHGVTIHHPEGDIKKISTYKQPAIDGSFNSNVSGTHWVVHWAETEHGQGVTEPGSSGCPLLNENKLFVGKLTGGNATCGNKTAEDYFGKIVYDWDKNGNSPDHRLKDWLDPTNSGMNILGGAYLGDLPPNDTTDFGIAPNPVVDGYLKVQGFGKPTDQISMQIYDLSGRLYYNEETAALPNTKKKIDVSKLANGIYVLRIITNSVARSYRVMIKN